MAQAKVLARASWAALTPRTKRAALVIVGLPVLGASLLWCCLSIWMALMPALPLLDGVSFSPLVLDRQGQLLRMGLTRDEKFRARVTLPEIAPHAVEALLLYEDRHFYRHFGVNPLALVRAGLAMLGGGRRMGGSTITMQVARLRFGLSTTSLGGKLAQMLLALRLERQYSKREILEAYFCLAPYGGNVEGIAAASRIYFGHAPVHLTLSESLALTPVPQNPVRRWPLSGATATAGSVASATAGSADVAGQSEFAAARARMENLWAAAHPRSKGRAAGSDAVPPRVLPPLRVLGPASLPFEAPHVSAALLSEASGTPLAQSTPRTELHTTLSLAHQKMLERRLGAFAARGRVYGLTNAAALLLHWPSMEIRALVGSANFGDARILGQVDGTLARRSPGSTLKPFIYALALDQGLIHPQTLLVDSPRSFGGYDPENFDRTFRGPLPAHEALRSSRNIPAIWLAAQLSPDIYAFLQRAEVQLPYSAEHYGLSLVLGGAEVSMRHLAELYAMLPNKGVWRRARLLRSDDTLVARNLLSPEAAVLTLRMLEEPGRALRGRQVRGGSMPHRYKTGTSNRFRDAWTVGVVGPYVLAVWAGNFDNSPNPLLVGGDVAAPLYEDIAEALALHEPLADLVPELHQGLNIIDLPVCTETGDVDVSMCSKTTETLYIPGRSPTRSSGVYRRILVDARTGLRACQPSEYTREEVREFWPTDLQALFARAGLAKPSPPPFGPECAGLRNAEGALDGGRSGAGAGGRGVGFDVGKAGAASPARSASSTGSQPRILSPRDGVVYQRRVGDEHSGRNAIPLTAGIDADADTVFWFVDERFVGRAVLRESGGEAVQGSGGAPVLWQPQGGTHVVRVVDNLGRASVRRVTVETLP